MSMKTFKVEIMPDGVTAKTVNPLGKEPPTLSDFLHGSHSKHEWQQAESERKLYEIEIINRQNCKCMIMSHAYKVKNCVFPHCLHKGSIHEATEINTKQIRIL